MTGKRAAGEKCGVRADLPERGILVLYLGLFAATALLLAWFQPLQPTSPMLVNPPDEFTRIVIPRYICDHGTLPTGFEPEVQIAGYGGSYAFFPYLPYIFMGWAMRLTSLFTGQEAALTMAARCVNVASGLLMAVTVYFLSRRVFQDRAVRWAFCYIVMFWPEQLFVHTYVNTESMSLLSTAMILLALVAVYQEGPEIRHSVLLAAGLVLCLLTYYNAYGYVLAAVVLSNVYFANMTYLKLQLQYENAYAFYTVLTARLTSLEGFDEHSRLAFVGRQETLLHRFPELDTELLMGPSPDLVNIYSRENLLRYYLGFDVPFASQEDCAALENDPVVQAMPVYPYEGSVRKIGDLIVIRLG